MENKTGKYIKYAIGEIVLVVIGILIALSINNWNQQRIAQNKEKVLLSELHQEFVKNKVQFDIVVSKHQLALDACLSLIRKFPIDLESVKVDSLPVTIFWDLKKKWTFNPSEGIINSLVSTSSFELITDSELRKLLVSWNDVLVDYQEDELHSKKYVEEVLNPYLQKHFHYIRGIYDPRNDASILASAEFENLIWQRREHLVDILGTGDEFINMQITINRIIELSKPKK